MDTIDETMESAAISKYEEIPERVACVRSTGSCAFVCLGFLFLVLLLSYVPVSGVTDAPAYARTLLYLSTAHLFPEVKEVLRSISPPPPSF
jgi:hypothetical protein